MENSIHSFNGKNTQFRFVLGISLICLWFCCAPIQAQETQTLQDKTWVRHTIDNHTVGADGVRLLDVNGDGLPDNATGWEEGNQTKIYLHPGHNRVRESWPTVKVGTTPDVEDAVFVDLDGNGIYDVVSCTEGKSERVFFHWAPEDTKRYLEESAWKMEELPASVGMSMWMFCQPLQIDGQNGIDLVIGGKDRGRNYLAEGGAKKPTLGWFESPADPRDMDAWKFHVLGPATWIMAIIAMDMDSDGNLDILITDRLGYGCFWLRHPGQENQEALRQPWELIELHRENDPFTNQVMFGTLADLDQDGLEDVVVAIQPRTVLWLRRLDKTGRNWAKHFIEPDGNCGYAKGVAIGDINGNGKNEIALTCESATNDLCGVVWLEYDKTPTEKRWKCHDLSGPEGIKFDQPFLVDLSGDGKLDVITTEERDSKTKLGVGIVWYENPF